MIWKACSRKTWLQALSRHLLEVLNNPLRHSSHDRWPASKSGRVPENSRARRRNATRSTATGAAIMQMNSMKACDLSVILLKQHFRITPTEDLEDMDIFGVRGSTQWKAVIIYTLYSICLRTVKDAQEPQRLHPRHVLGNKTKCWHTHTDTDNWPWPTGHRWNNSRYHKCSDN
jgi:hypothetical protein